MRVALELALKVLNIGAGDEVIVTPRTFLGSVSAIVLAGARPVFADVDFNSQNITPQTVTPLITSRTFQVYVSLQASENYLTDAMCTDP